MNYQYLQKIHSASAMILLKRMFGPILLVTLSLLLLSINCQLDPSRMRIVDNDENHYLVRGNLPIANNTFQFDKLREQLANLTKMPLFRIVIYNLLNFLTAKQTKNRYIQQNFFNEQQEYFDKRFTHLYKNHDIVGSFIGPSDYPVWLRKIALKYYNYTTYDKIPELLEKIETNMRSPFKTVVYVHCSQGVDRVGYVTGAYKMKHFGKSLAEVTKQNLQIMKQIRGHIHFNSFNGLQWYCLAIGRTQQECLIGVVGANRGNTAKGTAQHEHHHHHKSEHKDHKQGKQKSQL